MRWMVVWGVLSVGAGAQTPAAPAAPVAPSAACGTDQKTAGKNCVQTPAPAKSPAQEFPFPGDAPAAPAAAAPDAAKDADAPDTPVKDKFPFPGDAPAADAAKGQDTDLPAKDKFPFPGETAPVAPKDGGAAGKQFPYPGEAQDAPGMPGDTDAPAADPGAGSSSSSSSGGALPGAADDAAKPGLKDEGTEGSARSARRRLRPPAQKTLSDDERVDEDLDVAKFYASRGNLMGAYLRAKDAVKVEPNEPDGHRALAEVAEKMGKKDEAVAEYETYLKLDPDGDGVKAAKRALARLKP